MVRSVSPSGRLAYRPDLDGLRAIAVGLVIIDHAGFPTMASAAGVTAFFVLSGYLITSILIREDKVDLKAFYARRLRRLAPAFVVMLAIVGIAGLAGLWGEHWRPDRFLASVFYVTNWSVINGGTTGVTDHAWSLAIEEQFYLSWPLLVAIAPRRLVPIALAGIGAGLAIRTFTSSELDGYFSTFARMDGLLLGCLAAVLNLRASRIVGWAGLAILAVAALSPAAPHHLPTIAELGAVLIIVSNLPLGWLAPMGKRAYSLYLWNWPMTILFGPLGILPTFIAAELSYRLVERPFMERSVLPRGGRTLADLRPVTERTVAADPSTAALLASLPAQPGS